MKAPLTPEKVKVIFGIDIKQIIKYSLGYGEITNYNKSPALNKIGIKDGDYYIVIADSKNYDESIVTAIKKKLTSEFPNFVNILKLDSRSSAVIYFRLLNKV